MKLKHTLVLALAGLSVAACGRLHFADADKRREMDAALRQVLQSSARPPFVTRDQEGSRLWKQTQQFYARRNYAPAWIEDATPRAQMDALIKALHEAGEQGLDPELYGVSPLERRRDEASKGFLTKKGFNPTEAGAMDVWLTYLYMKHASDLADGMSDLAQIDPAWKIKPEKLDPLAHLEKALEENRIVESLTELTPDTAEYRLLKEALAGHKAQAANGGWPNVPSGLKLAPGDRSPHVRVLAHRLAASGDFQGTVPAEGQPAVYDTELVEAAKRFQRRHGLADDGRITAAVVAEMNVPIEQRIGQLQLNMERRRWLPRELGPRYIIVNIPEMRLDVWEDGRVPLSMRVVVGKADTQTPIFNEDMTHIIFSPYWNVPPSIAEGETLPAMMRDPGFLARNNMEIVNAAGQTVDAGSVDWSSPAAYRFRQRPGSGNSLGLVKFMFPNQFNVYMHDTPADSLFERAARSFSHGCVRLEQPEALANYVLRDQPEWTPERIREAMHAGQERTVKLSTPIPVYLGYWTARVSPDGLVQFRKDVYGIDGRQWAMLADRLKKLHASTAAATTATAPPKDAGKDKKGKRGPGANAR